MASALSEIASTLITSSVVRLVTFSIAAEMLEVSFSMSENPPETEAEPEDRALSFSATEMFRAFSFSIMPDISLKSESTAETCFTMSEKIWLVTAETSTTR